MSRLVIVGAGGLGREVLSWAQDISGKERRWEHCVFLDVDQDALEGYECDTPLILDSAEFIPAESDVFACAIGEPNPKLKICSDLQARGARFISLIHPTAVIGERCRIGEGCVICPGAVITADVELGDFVIVNVHATIGHDAVIGSGCTLSGHTDVTGYASLGEGVFLGSHAVVLPQATVGDHAVVGAGSVVLKRVRPGTTVFGVPAMKIL